MKYALKHSRNKLTETFINIKNTTMLCAFFKLSHLFIFPLAVYTSLSLILSLLHIIRCITHTITQIHFILPNASVASPSHREGNSPPMHTFQCLTAWKPVKYQAFPMLPAVFSICFKNKDFFCFSSLQQ